MASCQNPPRGHCTRAPGARCAAPPLHPRNAPTHCPRHKHNAEWRAEGPVRPPPHTRPPSEACAPPAGCVAAGRGRGRLSLSPDERQPVGPEGPLRSGNMSPKPKAPRGPRATVVSAKADGRPPPPPPHTHTQRRRARPPALPQAGLAPLGPQAVTVVYGTALSLTTAGVRPVPSLAARPSHTLHRPSGVRRVAGEPRGRGGGGGGAGADSRSRAPHAPCRLCPDSLAASPARLPDPQPVQRVYRAPAAAGGAATGAVRRPTRAHAGDEVCRCASAPESVRPLCGAPRWPPGLRPSTDAAQRTPSNGMCDPPPPPRRY